jgi:hypothetical protein
MGWGQAIQGVRQNTSGIERFGIFPDGAPWNIQQLQSFDGMLPIVLDVQ